MTGWNVCHPLTDYQVPSLRENSLVKIKKNLFTLVFEHNFEAISYDYSEYDQLKMTE